MVIMFNCLIVLWVDGDFTIETWVLIRKHTHWTRVIDFGNSPGKDSVIFSLSRRNSDQPGLSIENRKDEEIIVKNLLQLNRRVHLAGPLSGQTGRV